jgi:hypothetical protein
MRELDDRLVRNNGGISEPEFRLAPTIAYVYHSPNIRCAHNRQAWMPDALQ